MKNITVGQLIDRLSILDKNTELKMRYFWIGDVMGFEVYGYDNEKLVPILLEHPKLHTGDFPNE